jgi:hypothetical protein
VRMRWPSRVHNGALVLQTGEGKDVNVLWAPHTCHDPKSRQKCEKTQEEVGFWRRGPLPLQRKGVQGWGPRIPGV